MEEGQVTAKDFDYLLSMPMWSVTEEKIIELTKQMEQKRAEFRELEKKHIFRMWEEDLDAFEAELTKVEEKEERDRMANKAVKNDGKRGKGKAGKAKGAAGAAAAAKRQIKKKEPENEPMAKKEKSKKQVKAKDPEEMTLRERMAAKFGKDLPISSTKSMYSGIGSDNLSV